MQEGTLTLKWTYILSASAFVSFRWTPSKEDSQGQWFISLGYKSSRLELTETQVSVKDIFSVQSVYFSCDLAEGFI